MPRRREVAERPIIPDSKYNSKLVAKFINSVMHDGKKSLAESILYGAFDIIEEKTKNSPLKLFENAIENVRPLIEVKSRRVGGSTYQVPTEIRPSRRTALGIRWIISYARQRPEKSMAVKLAAELMDAANNRGATVKKKEDTHRMAEANKAFAHYRWLMSPLVGASELPYWDAATWLWKTPFDAFWPVCPSRCSKFTLIMAESSSMPICGASGEIMSKVYAFPAVVLIRRMIVSVQGGSDSR